MPRHADRNSLLHSLPAYDRDEILSLCRHSPLETGQVLDGSGRHVLRVYFPTSAYLSVHVTATIPGPEIMMAGFEGSVGSQLALGSSAAPLEATVQGAGYALVLEAPEFNRQILRSRALRDVLLSYVGVMTQQIARSCGCLHGHSLDARLARRLLMTQDAARGDEFHVTHEFFASVLGVRRVGVTVAASRLQKLGLISYRRGDVSVLDRAGLEVAACSCYAASVRSYSTAMRRPPSVR
jgi:hypothetical protein